MLYQAGEEERVVRLTTELDKEYKPEASVSVRTVNRRCIVGRRRFAVPGVVQTVLCCARNGPHRRCYAVP